MFRERCELAFGRCATEEPLPVAHGPRLVACHAVAPDRTQQEENA